MARGNHTGKGGFTKGHKPLPHSGRKKLPEEFKILLKAAVVPALKSLIAMSQDPKIKPAIREKACEYLIDREYGKPTLAIAGANGAPILVSFTEQDQKL